MVQVSKMRLAFEVAVRVAGRLRSPLKTQVIKSLKNRVGVKFNNRGKR